jgi:hypothetical protein
VRGHCDIRTVFHRSKTYRIYWNLQKSTENRKTADEGDSSGKSHMHCEVNVRTCRGIHLLASRWAKQCFGIYTLNNLWFLCSAFSKVGAFALHFNSTCKRLLYQILPPSLYRSFDWKCHFSFNSAKFSCLFVHAYKSFTAVRKLYSWKGAICVTLVLIYSCE